ncbi:nucleotidyltransferase family protein [Desulfococcus multivorans]|uniref:DNA polymerase beta domain protein region n=2 Tax=Desulfococcus TaxID=896 RepID=S7UJW6_DESML|nr:nucleotidyltransferase domain-containing protein [Desulfococcus multivorans]AQV03101.2 hypothetical protein B2D07_16720 [Desulfococcus multivorans]EPR34104.1 DNA polymerase beta domain protein region [Desulfococcus multivorans DSM 2059]SKA27536.1 hypothetical protein SAMN02745446_03703 [Desulfococcus multivorans DSM 2059]
MKQKEGYFDRKVLERNAMEPLKKARSKAPMSSKEDVLRYLKENKHFFQETFGVTRIGIFGSFAQDRQMDSSDIDMVVEFEKDKKNIHNFLRLKRFLEHQLERKVDLGFEHALKPAVREKIRGTILYG